jgi:hypothetical protein
VLRNKLTVVSSPMCTHQLSVIIEFIASGPFKFQCKRCGKLVYREHPRAVLPWRVLLIDRMGIIFLAVLFLVFPHLPLATAAFFLICGILYLVDATKEPLKPYTKEEATLQNIKIKKGLGLLLIFLVVGGVAYLYT